MTIMEVIVLTTVIVFSHHQDVMDPFGIVPKSSGRMVTVLQGPAIDLTQYWATKQSVTVDFWIIEEWKMPNILRQFLFF